MEVGFQMTKIMILILIMVVFSSVVYSVDIIRFSGSIQEPVEDFCFRQSNKDCLKADYMADEVRHPKDCMLIKIMKIKMCVPWLR